MADNILTKDRADANISIAAKDVAGVLVPRNILTDPSGTDLTPLTDAALRASAVPVSLASVPTHGVTGTFWQATQPVSIASMPTTPVSGTVALGSPTITALNATTGTHFQPGFDVAAGVGAGGSLRTDPDGNLVARAQVLTDELGYRANFANTSLAVGIGSCVFVNGSATVTGTGFIAADLRADDYVKLDADAEAAWAQISSLDSNTQLTLVSTYTGTGGTGASSRAIVKPSTGAGGAIAVASGVCTITSGTTTASITEVERDVDWLPIVKQSGVAISQRIANQTIYIGFYDEVAPAAPKWFAWFAADGTTNTTIKCQSGRNPTTAPSAAEIEETTVTLPNGSTTATSRRYRVEVLGDRVNFMIDGLTVATHFRSMPGPGDLLTSTVRVLNGTTPASTTTVTIDYDTCKNHNKLEVGLLSDSETLVALTAPVQPFAYNVAGVIAINTDLLIIDCRQARTVNLQAVSIGTTGRLDFFLTNDLTQIGTAQPAYPIGGGAGVTTTTAAGMWVIPTGGAAFLRVRLGVATTAGTTTLAATVSQSTHPIPAATTQPVSGTVTATANVTGYPTAAASADALANPTVTKIDATGLLFNGATWDRFRNNHNVAAEASSAKTATGNGATQTNFNAAGLFVWVNVTVVSGTTPTLTVRVQWSPDGGTNWLDLDTTNAQTVSITAAGAAVLRIYPGIATTANAALNAPLPRTWRLAWTIGGTTPSFTFAAQASYIL